MRRRHEDDFGPEVAPGRLRSRHVPGRLGLYGSCGPWPSRAKRQRCCTHAEAEGPAAAQGGTCRNVALTRGPAGWSLGAALRGAGAGAGRTRSERLGADVLFALVELVVGVGIRIVRGVEGVGLVSRRVDVCIGSLDDDPVCRPGNTARENDCCHREPGQNGSVTHRRTIRRPRAPRCRVARVRERGAADGGAPLPGRAMVALGSAVLAGLPPLSPSAKQRWRAWRSAAPRP